MVRFSAARDLKGWHVSEGREALKTAGLEIGATISAAFAARGPGPDPDPDPDPEGAPVHRSCPVTKLFMQPPLIPARLLISGKSYE